MLSKQESRDCFFGILYSEAAVCFTAKQRDACKASKARDYWLLLARPQFAGWRWCLALLALLVLLAFLVLLALLVVLALLVGKQVK